MDKFDGYEEVGQCNTEHYYRCDKCGEVELDFDNPEHYLRIFRVGKITMCEWCLLDFIQRHPTVANWQRHENMLRRSGNGCA